MTAESDAESSSRSNWALAALALVAVLAAAGGGYALGRGSGEDLAAARDQAEVTGRDAGLRAGRGEGYVLGIASVDEGRARAAYAEAYRAAYARAYRREGLYPPKASEITLVKRP